MAKAVEDFACKMMTHVLNGGGTADLAIEAILKAGTADLGAKGERLEDPAQWTPAKIAEKGAQIGSDKGPAGKFDD